MRVRSVAATVLLLLPGCSGPASLDLPSVVEHLLPGRSLYQTVKASDLAEGYGLTVSRLTREPPVPVLQPQDGDLWKDPVPPVPTLGQVAATVRSQEQSGTAPPATVNVQPRPPTP